MNLARKTRKAARIWRRKMFEYVGSDRYSHMALNDLDRKLAQYFSFRNGTFIEAGANDGITQSNTYWFERFRGWRGVLIEAVPDKAAECRRNRPDARVVNAALVANGDIKSVRMKTANLMAYVAGSFQNPDDERVHLGHAVSVQNLGAVSEVEVPSRTLANILEEFRVTAVDLFCLDVEGYELEVLKGLNVEKHRPRYILVETNRLNEVLDVLDQRYDVTDKLSVHDYLLHAKS